MPLGSFEPLPFRHGCTATLSPFHGDSFWLVLPPACPERGFEPSAPGGRCSEGRIGRNREYCKRQRGKTTIFQPALWVLRSKSRRGYKEAHISPFVSTPQSRLTPCQLPGRGAFWGATTNQKLSPRAGKVAWRSHDERGTAQSCQVLRDVPPQLRLRSAAPP